MRSFVSFVTNARMKGNVHFTSGGGKIRPVENLSVPADAESLAAPFPLTLTPLRGGGVEDAPSMSVVAPFIVVIGRRWSWEFSVPRLRNLFTCRPSPPLTCKHLSDPQINVGCIQTDRSRQRRSLVVRICYMTFGGIASFMKFAPQESTMATIHYAKGQCPRPSEEGGCCHRRCQSQWCSVCSISVSYSNFMRRIQDSQIRVD